MKKLTLAVVMLLGAVALQAQSATPKAVENAFSIQFAGAQKVQWEQEGPYWEAEFALDGRQLEAVYDQEGQIFSMEVLLNDSEIPDVIRNAAATQFPGYSIGQAELEEFATGYQMFNLNLRKGSDVIEVMFDSNGQVVESEADEDGDGEDDND